MNKFKLAISGGDLSYLRLPVSTSQRAHSRPSLSLLETTFQFFASASCAGICRSLRDCRQTRGKVFSLAPMRHPECLSDFGREKLSMWDVIANMAPVIVAKALGMEPMVKSQPGPTRKPCEGAFKNVCQRSRMRSVRECEGLDTVEHAGPTATCRVECIVSRYESCMT